MSEPELAEQLARADRAITKLVKNYGAEALVARDDAEELTAHSRYLVLARGSAGSGRRLWGWIAAWPQPVTSACGTCCVRLTCLTDGDLEHDVAQRLVRRRDEIGAVARATSVFRQAMQQNAAAMAKSA